jgi:hypothetical protein
MFGWHFFLALRLAIQTRRLAQENGLQDEDRKKIRKSKKKNN